MITLSDILLDLSDARGGAAICPSLVNDSAMLQTKVRHYHARHSLDIRRRVVYAVEREGKRDRIVEGRLAMSERRVDVLQRQRLAVLAAIDKLAGEITTLAAAGLDYEDPHVRALEDRAIDLLGCEPLDAERWPYAAASLRAREWPEDEETLVSFFTARLALMAGERMAA